MTEMQFIAAFNAAIRAGTAVPNSGTAITYEKDTVGVEAEFNHVRIAPTAATPAGHTITRGNLTIFTNGILIMSSAYTISGIPFIQAKTEGATNTDYVKLEFIVAPFETPELREAAMRVLRIINTCTAELPTGDIPATVAIINRAIRSKNNQLFNCFIMTANDTGPNATAGIISRAAAGRDGGAIGGVHENIAVKFADIGNARWDDQRNRISYAKTEYFDPIENNYWIFARSACAVLCPTFTPNLNSLFALQLSKALILAKRTKIVKKPNGTVENKSVVYMPDDDSEYKQLFHTLFKIDTAKVLQLILNQAELNAIIAFNGAAFTAAIKNLLMTATDNAIKCFENMLSILKYNATVALHHRFVANPANLNFAFTTIANTAGFAPFLTVSASRVCTFHPQAAIPPATLVMEAPRTNGAITPFLHGADYYVVLERRRTQMTSEIINFIKSGSVEYTPMIFKTILSENTSVLGWTVRPPVQRVTQVQRRGAVRMTNVQRSKVIIRPTPSRRGGH
jgi:hypothetical protein